MKASEFCEVVAPALVGNYFRWLGSFSSTINLCENIGVSRDGYIMVTVGAPPREIFYRCDYIKSVFLLDNGSLLVKHNDRRVSVIEVWRVVDDS